MFPKASFFEETTYAYIRYFTTHININKPQIINGFLDYIFRQLAKQVSTKRCRFSPITVHKIVPQIRFQTHMSARES